MTPGTLQQRHQDYVIGPNQDSRLASVAAGATVLDIELQLNTDAPFLLRSRCVRQAYTVENPPTQNGLQFLKTRWTGPTKDYRQQAFIPEAIASPYFGQMGVWKPEYPNLHYPAGGVLTVDVMNTGASAITNLYLFFRGVKLYPPGTVPAYPYPSRFKGIAFNYQIPVLALGVSEYRPDQTFTVKQDADFVLRGAQCTPPFNVGGTRQFSEVLIQLMDFNKKPYSNDFIPFDILCGGGGFPAAIPVGPTPSYVTPFGSGPGAPGLFYPEIYVPANHQLIYALQRSDGAVNSNQAEDFTINLIGQKIFPQS